MDHNLEAGPGSPTTPPDPIVHPSFADDGLILNPIITAAPPFDSETADIILQTSDRFQFHVWKCILAEASPVFEDMFALGKPQAPHNQQFEITDTPNPNALAQGQPPLPHLSVPVIEVPENCTTLLLLLRWIYPPSCHGRLFAKPGLDLKSLKPVLAAAHKYQMDGVVTEIADILIDDCSRLGPLRVYAIGARHCLPEVMEAAARATLSLAASDANAYVEELEDISGGAYHRLCEYRRQCVAILANMTQNLVWLGDGGWAFKRTLSDCLCAADPASTRYRFRDVDVEHVLSMWFVEHYKRMALLLQDRPCQEAITDEELYETALKQGSKCPACREVVHNHMRLFSTHMKNEINDRISEVRGIQHTYRLRESADGGGADFAQAVLSRPWVSCCVGFGRSCCI